MDGEVSSPTTHKNPIEAGAYITRDNYSWNTTLGIPATITYAFRATTSSYRAIQFCRSGLGVSGGGVT